MSTKAAGDLIFVDTNIWLDFYRTELSEGANELLALLGQVRERVISTSQVQMEFMKNRRKVIVVETLGGLKGGPDEQMKVPPIIADAAAVRVMQSARKAITERRNKIKKRAENILLNPAANDPVSGMVQSLFADPTDLILGRERTERYAVRRLARKRWLLGYLPRKDDDLSMGDAVNWEWVIDCAARHRGRVIIVSRDNDYGRAYAGRVFLNDWLQKEFKERVGRRCEIVLTNRLSAAFKLMAVKVPPKIAEAEASLVDEDDRLASASHGRTLVDGSGRMLVDGHGRVLVSGHGRTAE